MTERNHPLSEKVSVHPLIEKSHLLRFWKTITDSKGLSVSPAVPSHDPLKKIESIYNIFAADEDPSVPLNLLKKKSGFKLLAEELLLLSSVRRRNNIKFRNIIKSSSVLSRSPHFHNIIKTHLINLLKEKNYSEILTLEKNFREMQIQLPFIDKAGDESLFHLGIKEINENHLEKALDYLLNIRRSTPAVLHNTALCYQKLQRYPSANEYWIKLLRIEKKPKRSDHRDKHTAYTTTLKYIARNFLQECLHKEAYSYFKEVLSYTKDDREALEALFTITLELKKYSESLHFSKRLYELEPDNEEYLLNYIQELRYNKHFDTLIPLYEKKIDEYPDNDIFNEGLASCFLDQAWNIRKNLPEDAEKLMKKAKELTDTNPILLYLEGYFIKENGKKTESGKKFEKAVRFSNSHFIDYQLGQAFYEDKMTGQALKQFKDIASCHCDTSDKLFERAVQFLSDRNDYKNTMMLCDYGMKKKGYTLYDISDMLYDFHKASWAKKYSSRLILQDDPDEDDMYLHLTILNAIGNKEETLSYAQKFHQFFLEKNDYEGAAGSKEIMRQIRNRGRFKSL